MHADYLEIRKNFLSHAAPKRSMSGMPSDIRTAGPKGMRQKAIDKEAKNNPILRSLKRSYQNILGVADRYHTGKISYDQALSLFQGHQQLVQNAYDKGGPGWDAAVGTVGVDDSSAMKALGFSDADIRKFTTFFDEIDHDGGRRSQGSKAGMPSNIKHSAMKKSMAGMPSDIRTAGPKGMRQRANTKIINNNPQTARLARAYRSYLDVAKRYKSGKISYDQAKSLSNGLSTIITTPINVSDITADVLFDNFKDDKEVLHAFGITDDEWKLMLWFSAKMDNPNTNISRGSKAGMPSNIRR